MKRRPGEFPWLFVLAACVVAAHLGYRLLNPRPAIARPEAAIVAYGKVVTQDFIWRSPYKILRVARVIYRGDASQLVLTAERRPRFGRGQPRRSHLYLISPDVPGRVNLLSPEPTYNFWDVSAGDVDGDGVQEVGLCTYSRTARNPNYARRFFVYGWDNSGDLTPLWRGSQLCRPYETAVLADVTGDEKAELLSVERGLSGKLIVVAYEWNQFGFWGLGHTAELDAIGQVTPMRSASGEKSVEIRGRRGWRRVTEDWVVGK